jgi:membrane associated rhomboid family serine protease
MEIYIIICLIALILIGVVAVIQLMMSPLWGFLVTIIGPLTGALVGVYLGFKINDNRRKELDEEKR